MVRQTTDFPMKQSIDRGITYNLNDINIVGQVVASQEFFDALVAKYQATTGGRFARAEHEQTAHMVVEYLAGKRTGREICHDPKYGGEQAGFMNQGLLDKGLQLLGVPTFIMWASNNGPICPEVYQRIAATTFCEEAGCKFDLRIFRLNEPNDVADIIQACSQPGVGLENLSPEQAAMRAITLGVRKGLVIAPGDIAQRYFRTAVAVHLGKQDQQR